MISQDIQKYLHNEVNALSRDAQNQIEHIKKIHATCELLLTVDHERKSKSDLIKQNITKQTEGERDA